jgi:hypothetical protein
MKTIFIFLGLLIVSTSMQSQSFNKNISNIKKVEIHDLYGELKINGNNADELSIKMVDTNEIQKGIKNYRPNEYKTDNTQLGLHVSIQQDVLSIFVSNEQAQFTNYKIELPKNTIVEIENNFVSFTNEQEDNYTGLINDLVIKGMKNEIDINVFASNLKLNNVQGPLVVSAYLGNCYVSFEKFNQENPSTIHIIEGDIKVNFQFSTKAHVTLKSGLGDIKTNFVFREVTLEYDKQTIKKKKFITPIIDKNKYNLIEGDINKGGNQLTINSLNGKVEFYQYGNPVFIAPVTP